MKELMKKDKLLGFLGVEMYQLGLDLDRIRSCIATCALSPAELDKLKENEQKAVTWDALLNLKAETKDKEPFVKEVKEMMQTIWDLENESLTQEEETNHET